MLIKSTNSSHVDTGFKAAGGIKNVDDALIYLNLARNVLGDNWVNKTHFRFGASSLLSDLLSSLGYIKKEDSSSLDY